MELALAMPLLCLLLLGVVEIAVVVRDQLVAIEAARTGVRAAAVSADPASAATAAVQRAIGQPASVSTSISDGYVTVTVVITNHTDVPLIGLLMPDVELRGDATMILEPP
ncbi:unannotated protein [freshwater metagenome]|uniref:Unannotated protein n=1 Tax=freshwater metagenome TaxID=449393 RepID=A0A6J7FF08_9ZZZZ